MKPVELRLGPGHLIRGRVINPEGKPLDGVTVQAMDWKRHSSLDWMTKTDAQGRFTWDSAPEGTGIPDVDQTGLHHGWTAGIPGRQG